MRKFGRDVKLRGRRKELSAGVQEGRFPDRELVHLENWQFELVDQFRELSSTNSDSDMTIQELEAIWPFDKPITTHKNQS
ncbi:hypothetical protein KCU67_g46, partial [Aureobasidium melanogenum]